MSVNVQEIQNRIASFLDQSASITEGSADWTLRIKYLQQAESDWAEIYDWKDLYKEYNTVAISGATQSTPTDFRKSAGWVRSTYDLTTTKYFEEISPQEKFYYGDTNDYFYILGSPEGGYKAIMGRSHTSGASLCLPYYAKGASLASGSDVSNCPNPEYLVWKTIGYWLEAREDPRSEMAQNKASVILQNMIERENTPSVSNQGTVKNVLKTRHNFRVGDD